MPTPADLALATLAVRQNLLTREEAQDCLRRVRALRQSGQPTPMDALLVQEGRLTQQQIAGLRESRTPSPPPTPPAAATRAAQPAREGGGPPKQPIAGYQIQGKLGAGGMGTVFRALRESDNDVVAVKILFPQHAKNELFLARFQREAELLVQFRHPNIVFGLDRGCASGLHYLVMEYIEGTSVQDRINKERQLPEADALEIILQVAQALDYMQSQGIVHRDIKPDNVLLRSDGSLKLCDLGFAKPIGASPDGPQGMTCGTAQYMSPEQARGQSDLDIRSDIYSLGATLYHMVLGEVPFKGTDNLEIMAAQVLQELASTAVKSGKISRHMHYFIEKMMAKDKEIRYQAPGEVVEDIQEQMEGLRSMEFDPDRESVESTTGGSTNPFEALLRPRSRGGSSKPPSSRIGKKTPPPPPPRRPSSGLRRSSRIEALKNKAKKRKS